MSVKKHLSSLSGDSAIAALYVGLGGAILGELLPTPSDPLDFYWERKWRVELETGAITPEVYWRRMTAKYYLLDSVWWSIVLGTAILIKGDVRKKMMAVGALVGAGAVVGIIHQNIVKDTEYFKGMKFSKIEPKKI